MHVRAHSACHRTAYLFLRFSNTPAEVGKSWDETKWDLFTWILLRLHQVLCVIIDFRPCFIVKWPVFTRSHGSVGSTIWYSLQNTDFRWLRWTFTVSTSTAKSPLRHLHQNLIKMTKNPWKSRVFLCFQPFRVFIWTPILGDVNGVIHQQSQPTVATVAWLCCPQICDFRFYSV